MSKNKITINKKKIAEMLKSKLGLSNTVCEEIVILFFNGIYEVVLSEKKIILQNFGSFVLNNKKERPAQNLRLGTQIMLPARKVLRFVPSKIFKFVINNQNVE